MLFVRPEISQCVSRSVIITGAARSGTTMLGQLLHTLDNVEYFFEPPFLFSLIPSIREIPEKAFRLLYESYLFEDALMSSVAGRNLNLNRNDDSFILKAKSESDIETRLSSSYRRADLFAMTQRRRIVYKMPDVTHFLPKLQSYYPGTKVIVMFREPESVVQSLQDKGWYQDLDTPSKAVQGPFRQLGPDLPFWLQDHVMQFLRMTPLERLYIYYINVYEYVKKMSQCLVVDYDEFVRDPEQQFQRVCEFVGEHKVTDLTQERLQEVFQHAEPPRQTLYQIDESLRQRVLNIIDELSEKALVRI